MLTAAGSLIEWLNFLETSLKKHSAQLNKVKFIYKLLYEPM